MLELVPCNIHGAYLAGGAPLRAAAPLPVFAGGYAAGSKRRCGEIEPAEKLANRINFSAVSTCKLAACTAFRKDCGSRL